jgi:hypothetical protein
VESILKLLSLVALAAPIAALGSGWVAVRQTSLRTAWGWAAGAVAGWSVAWLLTLLGEPAGSRATLIWYGVALAMLCPPMTVLGARRPGAQAWTWFVVLPLLAVLSLPAVTALLLGGMAPDPENAFQLEAPWAIGWGLVVLMGLGNYIGTRLTLPALGYAAAVALLVGPQIEGAADWFPSPGVAPLWATLVLGAAGGLALLAGQTRPAAPAQPVDRLWQDFRDLYGVVWARRVMDRTNEALAARRLPARLEWNGVVWTGDASQPVDQQALADAGQHVAQTLRWLLKRFVDTDWIEQRLA